jgi:hypothetical protein
VSTQAETYRQRLNKLEELRAKQNARSLGLLLAVLEGKGMNPLGDLLKGAKIENVPGGEIIIFSDGSVHTPRFDRRAGNLRGPKDVSSCKPE